MEYRQSNLIILIGSLAAFFLLTSVSFVFSPDQEPGQTCQLYAAILMSLSFLIIPVWVSAGGVIRIIYLIFSIPMPIVLAFKSSQPVFGYFLIPTLFLLVGLGFLSRKTNTEERLEEIKIEEIQEDQNYLESELKKTQDTTVALQQKIGRYSYLNMVSKILSSNLNLDYIIDFVVNKSLEIVGKGDLALLYLVDEKNRELALANVKGIVKDRDSRIKSKKGDLYDNWALKRKQPLIVSDTKKDFRFSVEKAEAEKDRPFRALISTPLVTGQKISGILRLESNQVECFAPDDLRLLDVVGHLSSVAIENAILFKKTEELAIHDGLTGLYVHRYFQERFQEEIRRAMSTNSFLSLLMCDLDHFKKYNDEHGHIAGDVVLKEVASQLIQNIQGGDLGARYGGEEFALILPRRTKKEAIEIAESIRADIQSKTFRVKEKQARITISIGLVTFPTDGMINRDLIRRADEALYRAKEKGRNRVETC